MRITRQQLYAAFDLTDANTVFIDIIKKDEYSIYFYIDGKENEKKEIVWDGRINEVSNGN